MKKSIFREYDIRGIIKEELPLEEIELLGKGIISYFLDCDPTLSKLVIARDGRLHSLYIKKILIKVARCYGIEVIDLGLCPTPVFYFTLHRMNISAGLMITASHNPAHYNGMKLYCNHRSLWGKEIQEIYNLIQADHIKPYAPHEGGYNPMPMIASYIDFLAFHFESLKNSERSIIVDCGNGAAGSVLPFLIKRMGWKNVRLMFEKVDGRFPHHEADPTNSEAMTDLKANIEESSSTFGIAFDGDCDRMNAVSEKGELLDGDSLLLLFSKQVIQKHPRISVVCDVKSSQIVSEQLQQWGARIVLAPCGHSKVKEIMKKEGALLGGEFSCHFFFADRYYGYDDGIYAFMRLFQLLEEENQSLENLLSLTPAYSASPEVRLVCSEEQKHTIVAAVKTHLLAAKKYQEIITIDGVRAATADGWGLIRVSHTQPMVSLRFEGKDHNALREVKEDFFSLLSTYFDQETLKKKMEL